MKNLDEQSGGAHLTELAKSHPKMSYSAEIKPLIEQLKEVFGDEPICKLR